jgi:hypothetical protein
MNNIPKARYCKVCKVRFKPETIFQWWCCEDHKADYTTQRADERREQQQKSRARCIEKPKTKKVKPKKRSATKSEKEWLSVVAALGCVVCRNLGYGPSPAEIHHIRTGQGMAIRASHKHALPLCPPHHRTGGHGVAIHAGQKTWEENHGTELELLAQVAREVAVGMHAAFNTTSSIAKASE